MSETREELLKSIENSLNEANIARINLHMTLMVSGIRIPNDFQDSPHRIIEFLSKIELHLSDCANKLLYLKKYDCFHSSLKDSKLEF